MIMPWDKAYNRKSEEAKREKEHIRNQLIGKASNDTGHLMEKMILCGADMYLHQNRVRLIKVPEPFRVVSKKGGKATVYFIAHAEPDFIGCLFGGRCIAIEAKYTATDKIKVDMITKNQAAVLDRYHELGAYAFICCGIQDKYYLIPWPAFKEIPEKLGHRYAMQKDLRQYEVRCTGNAIMFLDYVRGHHGKKK